MAGWNFQTKNLLSNDRFSTEGVSIAASSTWYSPEFPITHLDSLYGIFVRLAGVITGAGAVTVQLQTALEGGAAASWADAGDAFAYTGTDLTALVMPTATKPFAPTVRVKISVAAATSVVFSKAQRTIRGLN